MVLPCLMNPIGLPMCVSGEGGSKPYLRLLSVSGPFSQQGEQQMMSMVREEPPCTQRIAFVILEDTPNSHPSQQHLGPATPVASLSRLQRAGQFLFCCPEHMGSAG